MGASKYAQPITAGEMPKHNPAVTFQRTLILAAN
jgi:hypothetical protein